MCRFLAYSGRPIFLDRLLIEPEASLVRQSHAAREAKTVVNGDGCGVGWYGSRPLPGRSPAVTPLAALKRISLRNDPPALALCGIAMAQLGEQPTGTAWVYTASCPLKS